VPDLTGPQVVWTVLDEDEEPLLTVSELEEDDHPVSIMWPGHEDDFSDYRSVKLTLTEAGEMCSALLEVINSRMHKEVEHWKRVADAASPQSPKRRGW
jgi:hypothetical protein